MSGVVRVVAEDLRLSASQIDMHADTLRVAHGAADGQIEAAQPGVPAAAAAALGGALVTWQQETAAHFTRMVDHSTGLQSGAAAYDETDAQEACQVQAAGDAIPVVDMGL